MIKWSHLSLVALTLTLTTLGYLSSWAKDDNSAYKQEIKIMPLLKSTTTTISNQWNIQKLKSQK
ncbi:MAG: hypothetical protein KME01_08895 [Chroococcus sp. CMT-3BRIN-NPC107]|jgi:uncharacterized membrane protein SirB2|nr:hypothetical protein [Chroococcus sp. CMT-3BRIN-NPC107]